MADKNLRINISVTGAEKTRAQIKKTTQGIGNMRLTTAGLRREIGKLRNVWLLWQFVMKPTLKLIRETTDALFEQEKAEAKLRRGLDNVATATTGGADKLIDYAAALQQVTTFGDEQIISAAAILATFQLNSDAIGHLLPRLLDMSTSLGGLEANALLLGKAFTGNAASLQRIGVQFDKTKLQAAQAQGEYAEFNFLVKSLDENYKGLARTLAETTFGQMEQLKNRMSDLSEMFGAALAPVKLYVYEGLMVLTKFLIEAYKATQVFMSVLAALVTGNMKILPELLMDVEDKFDKYIKTIDGATAAEDRLNFAAGKVNQQLMTQINRLKVEQKWSEAVTVAFGSQKAVLGDLNKKGEVEVGIQGLLHPLEEQRLRLKNQSIALVQQGALLAKESSDEAVKNATEQLELGIKIKKLDSEIIVAKLKHNAAFIGSLGDVAGEIKGGAKTAARLAQVAAMVDAYASYNKMVAQGGLFGIAPAAVALATGLANVLKISNSIGDFGSAQFGMDQIVSKPTLILTGEQNKRERVQVTPLQSPNLHGSSSGGVVVNINAPLVDETVRDSIMPSIQKALRSNAA
jgi:hypothetical protein